MAHVTRARFERPLDASARLGVPGLDSFRSAPPCSATTFLVTSCGGWSGSARHGADWGMERWLRELHPGSEVWGLRVSVRQLAQTGFALAIPVGIYTFNGHAADGLLGAVRVLKRLGADIYIYIYYRGAGSWEVVGLAFVSFPGQSQREIVKLAASSDPIVRSQAVLPGTNNYEF